MPRCRRRRWAASVAWFFSSDSLWHDYQAARCAREGREGRVSVVGLLREESMAIKSIVCWSLAALLLAGCQRYEPMPLDLAGHDAALLARDPAAGEVVAYARRLASLGRDPGRIYDPSDGLSLPEAEAVALFFNPALRQVRLQAKVPAVGAQEAGRWEDPELAVDGERILNSVDKPWVLGGLLNFTLPLSGRLGAAMRQALAEADAATLGALLQERQVVFELRGRWLEWSALQQRAELTRQYLRDLDDIVAQAEKLRQAGEIDQLDARLFRIERSTRQGELRVLELEQRQALLALKALMGLAPAADIRPLPTLSPPWTLIPATQPAQPALDGHPRLRLAKAEYAVAERTLESEIRKQRPDLTVGAGPGTEEGDSRVLFGLSLPLPVLNANRRAIAEAHATRDAAKAAVEATYEDLLSELARARVNHEAAQVRIEFLSNELVPLVDEQLNDARRLARLGEFQTLISLEAYTKAFQTKLDVLEATLKQAQAANQLQILLQADSAPVVETKP